MCWHIYSTFISTRLKFIYSVFFRFFLFQKEMINCFETKWFWLISVPENGRNYKYIMYIEIYRVSQQVRKVSAPLEKHYTFVFFNYKYYKIFLILFSVFFPRLIFYTSYTQSLLWITSKISLQSKRPEKSWKKTSQNENILSF